MHSKECPNIDELAACLSDNAGECEQVTLHLDHCQSCQTILDSLAGQPHWWLEAKESLVSDTRREAVRPLTKSICVLANEMPSSTSDPLCEHEVEQLQQLLEAPSHPELMGRIGRYELEQLVGRGGMGLVFRGYDSELHRVVAVKTLAIHLLPIRSARERFIREARACAALSHPHIVPIYDVLTDGPVPALVMQYVAGPTLEMWIDQQGALPVQQALSLTVQLSSALSAAHEMGLVHRDIKPGNVLLEADGSRALLTDFGLVRALDEATLTHSGTLAGTPDYMAPEQAKGEPVSERTDLFSLGSTLFAMLSGQPPFRHVSSADPDAADPAPAPMALLHRICHTPHVSLRSVSDSVPDVVSRLVDQLLEKSPKRRPESAAAVRAECQELLGNPRRMHGSKHRAGLGYFVLAASALSGLVLVALFALYLSPSRETSVVTLPPTDERAEADGRTQSASQEILDLQSEQRVIAEYEKARSGTYDELSQLDVLLNALEQPLGDANLGQPQMPRGALGGSELNPKSSLPADFELQMQRLHNQLDLLEEQDFNTD